MFMEDIPTLQALKAEAGITQPKYDFSIWELYKAMLSDSFADGSNFLKLVIRRSNQKTMFFY